jgi:two-component system chemotaxis sensor kinase CheA
MGAEVRSLVDALARDVMAVQSDDVQALAGLYGQFEQLSEALDSASLDRTRHAAQNVGRLLEMLILEPPDDIAPMVEAVAQTVECIQRIICDNADETCTSFPDVLGLPQADGTPADAPSPPADSDTPPAEQGAWTLPANVDQEVVDEFLARQPGVLEEMESIILQAEKTGAAESTDQMRRLLHTLKGEAGLLGFAQVAEACHRAEDTMLHANVVEMSEALLAMKDWLAATYDGMVKGKALPAQPAGLFAPSEPAPAPPEPQAPPTPTPPPAESKPEPKPAPAAQPDAPRVLKDPDGLIGDFIQEATDHLDNAEDQLLALEAEPGDREAINSVFRAFHTIKGVAGFLEFNDIQTVAHQAETLLDRVRKNTLELSPGMMDLFFDSTDQLKKLNAQVQQCLKSGQPLCHDPLIQGLLDRLQAAIDGQVPVAANAEGGSRPRLGEALVAGGAASEEQVSAALNQQAEEGDGRKLGQILADDQAVPAQAVGRALRTQRQAPMPAEPAPAAAPKADAAPAAAAPQPASGSGQARQIKEIVKVDADRLDRMVDTIGELVIAETMVAQVFDRAGEQHTMDEHRVMNQLGKITRELQEMATSLRMVPVRSVFQRMARLARDVAKKVNKPVSFQVSGEETELDKTVVDQIADPLIHLVRNAIDHGIEGAVEDRTKAGKPEAGQVHLRAFYKGGNVQIELEDDGRGLNREAILRKAIERGVVKEGQILSDDQINQLIFEPGFSMAQQVSEISGRGVGMDVVRRNVEAMRGKIDIVTHHGKGTRIIIKLPLTMAIMEGMVMKVDSRRYIVPTLSIVRMLSPQPADLSTAFDRHQSLNHGDQIIPLCDLGQWLGVNDKRRDPCESVVILVEHDGRMVALVADELIGQQQVVIKSLGETMRQIPGVSGGSIMPDGRVGLILDIEAIFRQRGAEETAPVERSETAVGAE